MCNTSQSPGSIECAMDTFRVSRPCNTHTMQGPNIYRGVHVSQHLKAAPQEKREQLVTNQMTPERGSATCPTTQTPWCGCAGAAPVAGAAAASALHTDV